MRKLAIAVIAALALSSSAAFAHQPVVLLNTDTTAAKGPLLVDGTVSFAIRAAFNKSGEKKAFRAQFQEGDALEVQYLIVDKKPENALKSAQLPTVVITGPGGFKATMKINERTKFYEPYGKTNYLYLARYSGVAKAGIYSFVITAKAKSGITLGVGVKEIFGEVVRGVYVPPTPTPTPTPTVAGYTMTQVRANNTARSCWTVVDDYVYNLTSWINSHPGGSGAILFLCGTDGTSAFKSQHANQTKPAIRLDGYKLGPLNK